MEAPAWKEYIETSVYTGANESDRYRERYASGMVAEEPFTYGAKKTGFPFGIYFGTRVRDSVRNVVGCVVGIQEDSILVAFENGQEPRISTIKEEAFEQGHFVLV